MQVQRALASLAHQQSDFRVLIKHNSITLTRPAMAEINNAKPEEKTEDGANF